MAADKQKTAENLKKEEKLKLKAARKAEAAAAKAAKKAEAAAAKAAIKAKIKAKAAENEEAPANKKAEKKEKADKPKQKADKPKKKLTKVKAKDQEPEEQIKSGEPTEEDLELIRDLIEAPNRDLPKSKKADKPKEKPARAKPKAEAHEEQDQEAPAPAPAPAQARAEKKKEADKPKEKSAKAKAQAQEPTPADLKLIKELMRDPAPRQAQVGINGMDQIPGAHGRGRIQARPNPGYFQDQDILVAQRASMRTFNHEISRAVFDHYEAEALLVSAKEDTAKRERQLQATRPKPAGSSDENKRKKELKGQIKEDEFEKAERLSLAEHQGLAPESKLDHEGYILSAANGNGRSSPPPKEKATPLVKEATPVQAQAVLETPAAPAAANSLATRLDQVQAQAQAQNNAAANGSSQQQNPAPNPAAYRFFVGGPPKPKLVNGQLVYEQAPARYPAKRNQGSGLQGKTGGHTLGKA